MVNNQKGLDDGDLKNIVWIFSFARYFVLPLGHVIYTSGLICDVTIRVSTISEWENNYPKCLTHICSSILLLETQVRISLANVCVNIKFSIVHFVVCVYYLNQRRPERWQFIMADQNRKIISAYWTLKTLSWNKSGKTPQRSTKKGM